MDENEQTAKQTSTRSQNRRPTIGYLAHNISGFGGHRQDTWSGVIDMARKRDTNLICFVGHPLQSPTDFETQANVVYDLVNVEELNGLVTWASTIGTYVGRDETAIFHHRYRPLPMTCMGMALEGSPCVFVDGRLGMREALIHLIQTHGYRRVAFIRGPEQHTPAQRRYQAYLDVLKEHGIPSNPDLISPPSSMIERSAGAEAVRVLLDQRKLRPKIDFEAITSATDHIALGAMDELQSRGIRVPEDVAVVGYDNTPESRVSMPPLTSVAQPFYEQGEQAVRLLLMQLAGELVTAEVALTPKLVVRQSCGCLDPTLAQAKVEETHSQAGIPTVSFMAAFAARREGTLSDLYQAMKANSAGLEPGWAEKLVDSFTVDWEGKSPGAFLSTLGVVTRSIVAIGGDVTPWQIAISVLRRHALPCLRADELPRAENLWGQARVLIGQAAQRAQMFQALTVARQTEALRDVSNTLVSNLHMSDMTDVLARELPRLGIPSFYLSLYENPQAPAEWARLILAYSDEGRIAIEPSGLRFRSQQLVPVEMLPSQRRYSMVVMPLYFQQEQLGFAIFEVGPPTGNVYSALSSQISSAIKGALLAQQVERHTLRLQASAEVSRTASVILAQDELIQQTVNLVRDRFNLYYVGLYLLDEPGRYAVLRAGTGEAGRQMLEQGHQLEVGGASMIGWCTANRQARIALDVSQEALRSSNPLLPSTRSELALPLISQGSIIGAVTIQSDQAAAFSSDDVTVLQTMADHVAVTIQNARLHAAEQERARELEHAYHTLQENQAKLLISEKMASLGRLTAGIAHEMNTPLAAVRAALMELDNLVQEYQDSIRDPKVTRESHNEIAAEMKQSIRLANTAAERAAGFVRGIKSQTRDLGLRERERFDAAQVIQETLLLLGHALHHGKCTAIFEPASQVLLLGSPGRLGQAVTNLVMNAIEASAAKGGGRITIGLTAHGDGIQLKVSDEGCGIPPENLPKIYDPLFTTKPFGQGIGLGLTILYDIVTGEFGGTIEVASQVGQGTTFTIHFPEG